MTPKERVLTALASRQPDRVPINYAANPAIDQRLKSHFGLAVDDHEGLQRALGVDFRGIGLRYIGPKLHEDVPEQGVTVDEWGIHRRWVEHETGGYHDYCDFPLRDADEETVATWKMPDPDDFDYAMVRDMCRRHGTYAVHVGNPGLGDIINGNGMLRGMEQTLVDIATEDPAGMLLARRRTEIALAVIARALEAADGGVDFLWMGEDLGTQSSPMISLELYRRILRPLHQRFIDLARSFGLPVMMHSCGSSSWAFADFVQMGITAVDTLQPEARDMSPEHLKKTFGGRLAFHGCISTARVAVGTVEATIAHCRDTLATMMPDGGYCFAPTHCLQDNSPTDNIVAMYAAARTYGRY